jgi:ABC-2 type transport system ATP-binding protein
VIEVRRLWKAYGERVALQGVDLTVKPGEGVALVGPNGSGKTTLLRALLGLIAFQGDVRISGHDPLRDHAAAQQHVAYVPQRAPALHVPVKELVAFWASSRARPAEALTHAAAGFGLDIGPIWSTRFSALSGGMQQKLLAAMALATPCPILLLDEPTANLDPHAREAFFAALAARDPKPTVVLSSHRLDEVRHLVQRVVVLTDGRVAFDDHLDRFLADPSLAHAAGLEGHRDVIPLRRTS